MLRIQFMLVLSLLFTSSHALAQHDNAKPDPTQPQQAHAKPPFVADNVVEPADGPPRREPRKDMPPSTIVIACVDVVDRHSWQHADAASNAPTPCPTPQKPEELIGAGDLRVLVDEASFQAIQAYRIEKGVWPTLFVNGVELKSGAELIGVERFGNRVALRYAILGGQGAKMLWGALYRSGKTTAQHDLRVGLGWSGLPSTDSAPQLTSLLHTPHKIAITDAASLGLAIALIVALIALGVMLGCLTDVFRDSKTPSVFNRARAAVDKVRKYPNDPLELNAALALVDPAYIQNPSTDAQASALAAQALAGADFKAMDPNRLALGFVFERAMPRRYRATFSLTRLQLGMWFLFAVATGVFIWAVYGSLPEIDNSLIGLLTLSAGVAGLSLSVDADNRHIEYRPSQGLFKDIVTDWNDQHQIHRMQAVVANLLLLAVGVGHVLHHLSYPIFPDTWIGFLAISGVAFAGGKKMTETKP